MLSIYKNGSRCFFGTFTPETDLPTSKGKKGVQSYNRITGLVALIFHKAYSLRDINGKKWILNKSSTISWIQRHEVQIVDNTIRLKIAEKLKNPTKEHIQDAIKIVCEAEHKVPEVPTANQLIEKMWDDYKRTLLESTASLDRFTGEMNLDEGSTSIIQPDFGLANLSLKFENDPYTLFIPKVICPTKTEELDILINALRAGFTSGKELVVVRLGTGVHGIMAAFSAKGEFKFIDSMSSQVINYKKIEKKLNQAKILGKNGYPIVFKGEYINTHIQKGGNTCARMSTLYAYHIAKTRNMDAYQEVNGAFVEGRLHTFEDYTRIEGAPRKKTVSKSPKTYTKFMESWAYRSFGYAVDHWHQLPLADIANGKLINPNYELACVKLDPRSSLPNHCVNEHENHRNKMSFHWEFGVDKGDGIFIPMDKIKDLDLEEVKFDSYPQTIGDAFSKDNSIRYLFYEKGNPQLRIVRLRPGEKLLEHLWMEKQPLPIYLQPIAFYK